MESLNLADTFATFLALIGPQKVLLSFGRLSRTLDDRSVRAVAAATAAATACVGALCALTAPWIATFFHIGTAELNLAAGLLFIIYAVGLVLGIHFDTEEEPETASLAEGDEAAPAHPLSNGFRAMLLPFIVSPIAIAADLEESICRRLGRPVDRGGRVRTGRAGRPDLHVGVHAIAAAHERERARGALPAARRPARRRRRRRLLGRAKSHSACCPATATEVS